MCPGQTVRLNPTHPRSALRLWHLCLRRTTSHNHATLPQSFSSLAAWLEAHSNSLLHHTEIFLILSHILSCPFPVSLSRNSWQRERREVKNPRQCAREISEWLFFFTRHPSQRWAVSKSCCPIRQIKVNQAWNEAGEPGDKVPLSPSQIRPLREREMEERDSMEGERCRKGRFAGFSVADSAFD